MFIEDFISNIIKYNNLDQLKNFVIDTLNNVREFYNILGINNFILLLPILYISGNNYLLYTIKLVKRYIVAT